MSDFFELDPVTGIRSDFKWNENDQEYTIQRYADVEPVIDYSKEMAADGDISKKGIKTGWWLYAKIPPIVMLQMRAKGIDIFNKNDEKRMFAELNTNYPNLKCTQGNHGTRVKTLIG